MGADGAAAAPASAVSECKQPVIDAVLAELKPIRERAEPYLEDPTLVRNIVADGAKKRRSLPRRLCGKCVQSWDWIIRKIRLKP